MRILGYILLVGGLAWSVFASEYPRSYSRAVMIHHLNELPKKDTFSRDETLARMKDVGVDMRQQIPQFLFPALMMLCGGIFLDRNRKIDRDIDA